MATFSPKQVIQFVFNSWGSREATAGPKNCISTNIMNCLCACQLAKGRTAVLLSKDKYNLVFAKFILRDFKQYKRKLEEDDGQFSSLVPHTQFVALPVLPIHPHMCSSISLLRTDLPRTPCTTNNPFLAHLPVLFLLVFNL